MKSFMRKISGGATAPWLSFHSGSAGRAWAETTVGTTRENARGEEEG